MKHTTKLFKRALAVAAVLGMCASLMNVSVLAADDKKCDQVDAYGNHKVSEEKVDPTCDKDGYIVYWCDSCGYNAREALTATGHSWDSGKVTKEPTCNDAGEILYTCKKDSSHTRIEPISATDEHKHTHEEIKESTCTAPGWKKLVCDDCGKILREEECPQLKHEYLEDGKCKYCGKCKNIDETGCHKMVKTEHPATCTEHGYVSYKCDICGETMPDMRVSEPLGHLHDVKTVTEATCTEKGNITYSCSRCGTEVGHAEIAPIGHSFTGAASSKGEEGHVFACENGCGEYGGFEKHCFTDWSAYNENHVRTRACTDCGYVESEGCKHEGETETVVGNPPTCTEKGNQAIICADCGATIANEEIDPIGHKWDDGVVTKEPTCTEKGVKTFTCANDASHTRTEELDALGHRTPPVYTDNGDGTHDGNCGDCGETIVDNETHEDADNDGKCDDCGADLGNGGNNGGSTGDGPTSFTPYYPERPSASNEEELDEEVIGEEDVPLAGSPAEEEILEEEVPLAGGPSGLGNADEEIPEEDVPLVDAPKTGHSAQPWILVTLVSCAGLALSAMGRKRRDLSK